MNIKDKLGSIFGKARAKTKSKLDKINKSRSKRSDSELGAEEVVHEEVFPKKSHVKKATNSAKKPASKRTRPTNIDYQMIDPDDNTCDSSKS